jgi:DNA-binding NarL/FixJ family response regulator
MKRHLFISKRREPLPRWLEAFPEAELKLPSTLKRPGFCMAGAALIWLHIEAPTTDIATIVAEILRAAPGCPIVVLANVPSEPEGYQALRAGASGYCHTLATVTLLHQVALVVENGGIWVGRELKQRLLGAFTPLIAEPDSTDGLESLSPRQKEVAEAVAKGASNKEVARALAITERTVKAHLSSIFEHLGVRDRVQLALLVNNQRPETRVLKYGTGP